MFCKLMTQKKLSEQTFYAEENGRAQLDDHGENSWLDYIENIGETLSVQNAACISGSKNMTAQSLSVVLETL